MNKRPDFRWTLLAPRHWPIWLGFALLRALVLLPHGWQLRFGRALGPFLRRALRSRERVALRNLELCFPEQDDSWRRAVVRELFASLGMMIFEIGSAWWGSPRRHRRLGDVRGLDALQRAQADGRGVLLLFGHFTSLELAGRLLAYHQDMAGLYREHGNPVLEYIVRRRRLNYGEALFNRNELRGMVKYLRAGGVLWYAPDQDYQRGENVFAPFFGVPASTTTSTHQLARMGRARVLVTRNVRRADGRYEVEILDPVPEVPSADVTEDCRRINEAIEALVRACPEQYLWVHRRFKTRPEGEASLY
ncbi:MAG: LpxL/LpxP family Kdo(2)-lipid IV(A) lauroyl/palmitoleoyl acyltransferase [Xanthomonadales bacterium]|nr:LpxL/LpxP family Kdo(2)-lipid IV(A) lauroyl/palmitoleoyl acyltransferase [Xanthomonadales bacterium]